MPCYCEVCGRRVDDDKQCRKIILDNAIVIVCLNCYNKLITRGRAKPYVEKSPTHHEKRWIKTSISKRLLEDMYEVVEDYASRIRKARQKLGWTQSVLAQKLRVSENVIKRIEAGRLKPSIELARKMEKILGIILLEPITEEPVSYTTSEEDYLTIGDIIRVREKDKE